MVHAADARRGKRKHPCRRKNATSLLTGVALLCLFLTHASAQDESKQKTRLQAKTDYFQNKIEDSSTEPWRKIPYYDSLASLYSQLDERQNQYKTRKEQIALFFEKGYLFLAGFIVW